MKQSKSSFVISMFYSAFILIIIESTITLEIVDPTVNNGTIGSSMNNVIESTNFINNKNPKSKTSTK